MENYLQNLDAWCWSYPQGNGKRKRKPHYQGLHFTAKHTSCNSILHCMRLLRHCGPVSHRRAQLRLLDPANAAMMAGTGGQPYVSYQRLCISLHEESDHLRQFAFRVVGDTVHFDFTPRHMAEFEKAILEVRERAEDCSVCPKDAESEGHLLGRLDRESEKLWFWPEFGWQIMMR